MEKSAEAEAQSPPEVSAGEDQDDGTSSGDTPKQTDQRSMSVSGESLYALLNIKKDATEDEIKKAYRKLALRFHPDKNRDDPTSAEEKFKEINRAHKVLTDEKKKKIYDDYGSLGLYIADTVGEDYVGLYFMLESRCFKITSIICCIATGCCCCCCCLFCCFGCCGLCNKCRSKPEEDEEMSDIGDESLDDVEAHETKEKPVTIQPGASGGVENETFAMPAP